MECPDGVSTNWYESPWEALGRTPLCWPTKDESKICQESKQLAPPLAQLVAELVAAQVLVPAQVLQFQLDPSPVLVPKVPSLVPVQPIP